MTTRTLVLVLLGFSLLMGGLAWADDLPGLDGKLDDQNPSENISPEANYSQQVLSATYGSRDAFLIRASWQWMQKGNDPADITLAEASDKGLLPFWIFDPQTKVPVRILTTGNPSGSDVVLLSNLGGLACMLIHRDQIGNPGAEPIIINPNSFTQEILDKLPEEDMAEIDARRQENHPTDWAVMMDGLNWNIKLLVPLYIADHGTLPTTIEQLLDDNYFLNQDFLDFAKSLIGAGESTPYECGVVPDENILYFDNELQYPLWYPTTIQFDYVGPGYDLTDSQNKTEKPWPQGLSLGENRIVLLSDEMFAEPEKYFSSDITRPLSDFYTAN